MLSVSDLIVPTFIVRCPLISSSHAMLYPEPSVLVTILFMVVAQLVSTIDNAFKSFHNALVPCSGVLPCADTPVELTAFSVISISQVFALRADNISLSDISARTLSITMLGLSPPVMLVI